MYEGCREERVKQVDETSFVSIQAYETTDAPCKSQMVVVLTFLELVEVRDKTGLGLSNNIKHVLEPLKLEDKLTA